MFVLVHFERGDLAADYFAKNALGHVMSITHCRCRCNKKGKRACVDRPARFSTPRNSDYSTYHSMSVAAHTPETITLPRIV